MQVTRSELLDLALRYREQTRARPEGRPLAELGVSDPYEDRRDTHRANEEFLAGFQAVPGSPAEVRATLARRATRENTRAVLGAGMGVLVGGGAMLGSLAVGFLRSWPLGLAVGLGGAGVLAAGILIHNRAGAREDQQRILMARLDRWERSAREFKLACPPRAESGRELQDRGEHLVVGGVRLGKRPGE